MDLSQGKKRPKTAKKPGKQPKMVSYAEFKEIQRSKEIAHVGPGAHTPYKEFGADVKTKVNFGSKYKWKPDNNPPPGLYDVDKAMIQTKPNMSSTRRLDQDRSKRSDFTKLNHRENPSGGEYDKFKPFGQEASKYSFGGKYKWKPDSNPPPGLYDPNMAAVKGHSSSVLLSPDKTKRVDFTATPMKDMPDAGLYDKHIKPFGSDAKKVDFGGKYIHKYDNNPPVGIYDPTNQQTMPRTRSAMIKTGDQARSKFTESPTRDHPDGGAYSGHIKPFGHGMKNPMTKKGKYDFKPSDNPPPGLYDLESSSKLTKPKSRAAVIKDVQRYPVYD